MTEKRYLAEYEVHSIYVLDSNDSLTFKHPKLDATIRLRNKVVDPSKEYSTLSAYLNVGANSIREADFISDVIITEFINMFVYVTNMGMRLGNKLKIVDRTPGIEKRQYVQFLHVINPESSFPAINESLVKDVEFFLREETPDELKLAIKWFSLGVSADHLDDQFRFFYFAIETLAQFNRPTEKVNDFCAKCRAPLYCESCEEHPKHKPYPKQVIQLLFNDVIERDGNAAFEIANRIRNKLMHGCSIRVLEQETGTSLYKQVNVVGRVARFSILKAMIGAFQIESALPEKADPRDTDHLLHLFNPEIYARMGVFCMRLLGTFDAKDVDSLQVSEIPMVSVKYEYNDYPKDKTT